MDLVISGHAHDYERLEENGITYLVIGGAGAEQKPDDIPILQDETVLRGIVDDDIFHHWVYIEANADGVTLDVEVIRLSEAGTDTVSTVFDKFSVPARAVFEDISQSTGIDHDGQPFSSVSFDYNGDGQEDLLVTKVDEPGNLHKLLSINPLSLRPTFDEVTLQAFDPNELPVSGSRGIAVADYDNDGDLDVFVAAATDPRLYINTNGVFEDKAPQIGLATLAASSWSGSWGDYNNDGFIDLYVTRAGGTATPSGITGLQDRLFESYFASLDTIIDATAAAGLDVGTSPTLSASWADIDSDSDLDLFVGRLAAVGGTGEHSLLFVNDGSGSFTEEVTSRFGVTGYVSGIVWADYNQDGYLDISLSRQKQGDPLFNNNVICFNTPTNLGTFVEPEEAQDVFVTDPRVGLLAMDHDLNGFMDLLSIPESGDEVLLYAGLSPSPELRFARVNGLTGLPNGATQGVVSSDFNLDGDPDVFLGRTSAQEFYLEGVEKAGTNAPSNNWVAVRLEAPFGCTNDAGIGAQVKLEAPLSSPQMVLTQLVDGGSGRGSQASLVLTFGLASIDADVRATVIWPNGYVQTETIAQASLKSIVTITNDEPVTIQSSSVTCSVVLQPGAKIDYFFEWTTSCQTDPSLDKVVFGNYGSPPSQCIMSPVTITPAGPNTTHSVTRLSNGKWKHELSWEDQDCAAACFYEYDVESGIGTNKNTVENKLVKVLLCAQ